MAQSTTVATVSILLLLTNLTGRSTQLPDVTEELTTLECSVKFKVGVISLLYIRH